LVAREEKYANTNKTMHEVLSQDIRNDIKGLMEHLKRLEKDLDGNVDYEPSNEELVLLYEARRTIKEQMSTKIIEMREQFAVHKEERVFRERKNCFG
jgi:hypothetical protein